MWSSNYTDEEFEQAVKDSKTMKEVMVKLGMTKSGGNYKIITKKAEKLNISLVHLYKKEKHKRENNPDNINTKTDEQIKEAVKEHTSIRSVILSFGLKENGTNNRGIRNKITELKLNIDHFLGQGHLLDGEHNWAVKMVEEDIYIEDSKYKENSYRNLKKRLINENLIEDKCSDCGIGNEYNGKPITIQLHHINGNRKDNRVENLQMLCPNCHSQTDNFCFKNSIKYKEGLTKEKILCVGCQRELSRENKSGYCAKCKPYTIEIKK